MTDAPSAVDPAIVAEPTAYDEVVYPTTIFAQTVPDRAAIVARLAGLSPPPIETARVLEIGCGDGMNVTALAAAWPRSEFVGIDLAASAIARGTALIDRAGLGNVRLHVCDIRDAATRLSGKFDYIIAHGIYAWVPADVRAALMDAIGALLSDDGVGYVSYNALPGGYLRLALRDALLFHTDGLTDSGERLDAAYQMLSIFSQPLEQESSFATALREAAALSGSQAREVLHHDELGEHYHPQSLTAVVAEAQRVGLRFLGDAAPDLLDQAFLPEDVREDPDVELQIVRQRQAEDYRFGRFFRHTLFVRDHQRPRRHLELSVLDTLYAGTRAVRVSHDSFRNVDDREFEIADAALLKVVARLSNAFPGRVAIADLALDVERRMALFEMFNTGHIQLYGTPVPFALEAGEAPKVSPLVRAMIAVDQLVVPSLDHRLLKVADAGPRALIARLDGSLSGDALAAVGAEAGLDTPEALQEGLRRVMERAILVHPGWGA